MAVSFTTDLFNYMDQVTQQFVASNLSVIISTVTPLIGLALTGKLIIDGLFTMARPNGAPLNDLIKKFIVWALIISFASAGGWYQNELANVAMKLPDEFAKVLVINGQTGGTQDTMGNSIDNAIHDGMQVARDAFDNADIYSGSGLAALVLAICVILSTVVICGVGAGLVLMSKMMLAITVCFGPIFIFLLLFKSLQGMFNKWLGSIINYGLIVILLSMVFGLMIKFFQKALDAVTAANADSSLLGPVFACLLIMIVTWLILQRIPELAARWGDGVSAHINELMPGGGGDGGNKGDSAKGDTPQKGNSNGGSGNPWAGNTGGAAAAATTAATGGTGAAAGAAMQGFAKGSRR
ncbi:TPA: type IV secretion system protein [Klebsiella pneumoniae]|nr:type IV secretion system protein [Klebsiella pneumoniae]